MGCINKYQIFTFLHAAVCSDYAALAGTALGGEGRVCSSPARELSAGIACLLCAAQTRAVYIVAPVLESANYAPLRNPSAPQNLLSCRNTSHQPGGKPSDGRQAAKGAPVLYNWGFFLFFFSVVSGAEWKFMPGTPLAFLFL